jgi:RimJ/RimL family protein N-acetyltransferase
MKIEFKPFQESDLPLFRKWLAYPHVAPFWQETEDDEKLKEKFFGKHPQIGVHHDLIFIAGEPVGFIQHYEAGKVGGGWWPDEKPGVYGVDLFIGEPQFYSKGWGPKILIHYIQKLISEKRPTKFIIDPEPANARAIRAYEKIGFVKQALIQTPNGEAQLMTMDPQEFLNPTFRLQKLDPTWIPKLQNLLEAAPQYNLKVEGRQPTPTAAEDTLNSGPPNFDFQNKHTFGFFRNDLLIGCVDIANGYPEKEIAYLGLLLIDESLQGLGLGTRAFHLVEAECAKWQVRKIRLSVAESNDVTGFWRKVGFVPTGRILNSHQKEIISQVIEMEKPLA